MRLSDLDKEAAPTPIKPMRLSDLDSVPAAAAAPVPTSTAPDQAEMIAGNPLTRFALGAASPFLGAAQLGSEALGFKGVTEHLKRLEEMKKRGMSNAAEVERLKVGREILSKLTGYEATISDIDKKIVEMSKAPQESGMDVAGVAGTILSPAALAAMKIAPSATVLGRSGQGAAIGAGLGATSPVVEGDNFAANKAAQVAAGTMLGGAIPPAIDLTGKVYKIGRNIVDPMLPGGAERVAARLLSEAAGDKRPAIEAALAANRVAVPGSQPTAAEVAAPAGSPTFSALQSIVARRDPDAYSDIAKAQEAARLAAVRGVGQTPKALEDAITARKDAADPLYAAARDPANRAFTKPVIDRVDALLKSNPGNRELVLELVQIKRGLTSKGIPRESAEEVASVLDGIKASMGKEDNKFILGQLNDVKKQLAATIPGYSQAQAKFSELSKPVNEMQVGQQLEKALTKPLGGENPAAFAEAMREAHKTIKKSTGYPRFNEMEDVLSPDNLKAVKGVLEDLSRKSEFDKLASKGAGAARAIAEPFGLPATGPLNQQYMIFKTILGRVSKGVNQRVMDTMSDVLQIPEATLKMLQKIPDAQQQKAIDALISQKIGRGAIAAAMSNSGEASQ